MRSGRAPISRALKFTWNADLLKVRGELRLDDGDIAGVVHDADAMLKLQPANAYAMAPRGAALARKKDYANALADLDSSIEADPKDAMALGVRGQVYLAKGDEAGALSDLDAPSRSAPSARRPTVRGSRSTRRRATPPKRSPISTWRSSAPRKPGRCLFRARWLAPSQGRHRQGARRPE